MVLYTKYHIGKGPGKRVAKYLVCHIVHVKVKAFVVNT